MWTHSHVLVNAYVGYRLTRSRRVRLLPFVFGAVAPDLPLFVLTLSRAALRRLSGTALPGEGLYGPGFNALFYGDPLWLTAHNSLHAPFVLGLLAMLSWWGVRRHLRGSDVVGWVVAGCLVHTGIDILTHHGDGPLLLFPFEWSYRVMSPVSYWDPGWFGRTATLVEATVDLAILVYLGRAWRATAAARLAETPSPSHVAVVRRR